MWMGFTHNRLTYHQKNRPTYHQKKSFYILYTPSKVSEDMSADTSADASADVPGRISLDLVVQDLVVGPIEDKQFILGHES